jgi:rubrerythrin
MNIFELAMSMETEGRNYYLKHAENTDHPALKKILLELADDELKHFNHFKAMAEGVGSKLGTFDKTKILESAKAIWQAAAAESGSYEVADDAKQIWVQAAKVEKKSEELYREKAGETDDASEKKLLLAVAEEEHRHWKVINSVVEFLDYPERYIADAEWGKVDEI